MRISLIILNKVAAATPSNGVVSSVKKGTILSGLNIRKDQPAVEALDDNEYPAWLWTLLDTPSGAAKSSAAVGSQVEITSYAQDEYKNIKKEIKKLRKVHIKQVNSQLNKK